jgi:hypothetical protein
MPGHIPGGRVAAVKGSPSEILEEGKSAKYGEHGEYREAVLLVSAGDFHFRNVVETQHLSLYSGNERPKPWKVLSRTNP